MTQVTRLMTRDMTVAMLYVLYVLLLHIDIGWWLYYIHYDRGILYVEILCLIPVVIRCWRDRFGDGKE